MRDDDAWSIHCNSFMEMMTIIVRKSGWCRIREMIVNRSGVRHRLLLTRWWSKQQSLETVRHTLICIKKKKDTIHDSEHDRSDMQTQKDKKRKWEIKLSFVIQDAMWLQKSSRREGGKLDCMEFIAIETTYQAGTGREETREGLFARLLVDLVLLWWQRMLA